MDHLVKRVVAARVASIHVSLQQNYAQHCDKPSPLPEASGSSLWSRAASNLCGHALRLRNTAARPSAKVASNGSRKHSLMIRTFGLPSFPLSASCFRTLFHVSASRQSGHSPGKALFQPFVICR